MDEDVYQHAIRSSKDNPFKRYLEFLKGLGELTQSEEKLYDSIGREFLSVVENTNMTKVYKMPVLMAFYNDGNMRMKVSEDDLLNSWKEFFNTGTNWKDLDKEMTYEQYLQISDRDHIRKILQMPVHFLQESGKGFFVSEDGCPLALRSELKEVIKEPAFVNQFRDIIDYRTMDYYKRRYREKSEEN